MALVTTIRNGVKTERDACVRKVYVTDPETGYLRTRPHFVSLVDGQCPAPDEHAWDDAWEVNRMR